jgi:tetratricopeptide (TPR) repeat protein
MRRVFALLLSLPSLTASLPAAAQTATEAAPATGGNDVEQARQRFQRGAELYKEGSFDAALAEFTRAYQLVPNYRVLYNIAQVQIERHDYAAALQLFQDYLRQGAADVAAERREQVEREITSLKGRVAELSVSSNVEGAELSVDGVLVGKLPLKSPVLVSSGVRRLTLKKPGYPPSERTISVVGGDKPEVELRLDAPRPTLESSTALDMDAPAREEHRPGLKPAVWISLGATGVFAGTALTFGLLARQSNHDLDKELDRFPAQPSRIDDVRSRLKLYAGLTDGFAAAAGVSALLAVYFAVSGSRASEAFVLGNHAVQARLVPTKNGVSLLGGF